MANDTENKEVLDFDRYYDMKTNKQKVDFTAYDVIDLEGEPLDEYKKISFKNGAEVNLGGIEPLPKQLDVSMCASVDLSGRDLSTLENNIVMKEGSSFTYNANGLASGMSINNDDGISPLANKIDVSRCAEVSLIGTDLSQISELKFNKDSNISLIECSNIPANTDFSQCHSVCLSGCDLSKQTDLQFKAGASVDLAGCTNIPQNLDLSQCDNINLSGVDLSQIKNLKFKDGANINLSGCTNIPPDLDVSNCAYVNLAKTDLSDLKELKLKDGAELDLSGCQSLPQKVDFDKCDTINLSNTDLTFGPEIKFKDGAEVNLSRAQNIPDDIDFSKCAKLDLSQCNLGSGIIGEERKIQFREDAEVNMSRCKDLPKDLDLSACKTVNLSYCDLAEQNNLKFKADSRVALYGCENMPQNTDASQCKEIWLNPEQIKSIHTGDAHVALTGIGVKEIDATHLKSFTTAQKDDPVLGSTHLTLLTAQKITFANKAQYDEYVNNPDNVKIPPSLSVENGKIIFADEARKDLAQALANHEGGLQTPPEVQAQVALSNAKMTVAANKRKDEMARAQENPQNVATRPTQNKEQTTLDPTFIQKER